MYRHHMCLLIRHKLKDLKIFLPICYCATATITFPELVFIQITAFRFSGSIQVSLEETRMSWPRQRGWMFELWLKCKAGQWVQPSSAEDHRGMQWKIPAPIPVRLFISERPPEEHETGRNPTTRLKTQNICVACNHRAWLSTSCPRRAEPSRRGLHEGVAEEELRRNMKRVAVALCQCRTDAKCWTLNTT